MTYNVFGGTLNPTAHLRNDLLCVYFSDGDERNIRRSLRGRETHYRHTAAVVRLGTFQGQTLISVQ